MNDPGREARELHSNRFGNGRRGQDPLEELEIMIQSQEPLGFERDTAILAMPGPRKRYQLGGEELRVLRDINLTNGMWEQNRL